MGRRKGELSDATLDREFPFQVALPADQVAGKNHDPIKIALAASRSFSSPGGSVVQKTGAW